MSSTALALLRSVQRQVHLLAADVNHAYPGIAEPFRSSAYHSPLVLVQQGWGSP